MSFRCGAMLPEASRNGWTTVTSMPVTQFDMQFAINTQLSQPTGIGAFDGQHGMLLAISSVPVDAEASSAIACVEASDDD